MDEDRTRKEDGRDDPRRSDAVEEPSSVDMDSANDSWQGDSTRLASWEDQIDDVIAKNFLFFEAQESGRLRYGHRIKWRGDSYTEDMYTPDSRDGNSRDLAGGWFDAGGMYAYTSRMRILCTNFASSCVGRNCLIHRSG